MTTAIEKLAQAEKWLSEAKALDQIKQIHDIAVAAEAYARVHQLGLDSENHAREIKFVAARRIGELVPPIPKKESNPLGRGKVSEQRTPFPIPPQRLSDFRKLADKVTEPELRERCHAMNESGEKITYNKIIRGDWYQMSETPVSIMPTQQEKNTA